MYAQHLIERFRAIFGVCNALLRDKSGTKTMIRCYAYQWPFKEHAPLQPLHCIRCALYVLEQNVRLPLHSGRLQHIHINHLRLRGECNVEQSPDMLFLLFD